MAPSSIALSAVLTLLAALVHSSPHQVAPKEPLRVADFTYKGCYTDAVSKRVLVGKSYFDDRMTLEKCAAACSKYPFWGVEYGRECYVCAVT